MTSEDDSEKEKLLLELSQLSQKIDKVERNSCLLYCDRFEGGKIVMNLKPSALEDDKSDQQQFEDHMKKLTGSKDFDLALDIFTRGVDALPGAKDKSHVNIVLQALSGDELNDTTEARLCVQETVLYAQGMKYLKLAEMQDKIPQAEYYMKNAIKLLRLHNETVETFNKHRRGGEQRVTVQHVNVEYGGKAVVGGSFDGGGRR